MFLHAVSPKLRLECSAAGLRLCHFVHHVYPNREQSTSCLSGCLALTHLGLFCLVFGSRRRGGLMAIFIQRFLSFLLIITFYRVRGYVPASPTNDTTAIQQAMNVTGASKLHLQWCPNGYVSHISRRHNRSPKLFQVVLGERLVSASGRQQHRDKPSPWSLKSGNGPCPQLIFGSPGCPCTFLGKKCDQYNAAEYVSFLSARFMLSKADNSSDSMDCSGVL